VRLKSNIFDVFIRTSELIELTPSLNWGYNRSKSEGKMYSEEFDLSFDGTSKTFQSMLGFGADVDVDVYEFNLNAFIPNLAIISRKVKISPKKLCQVG
jgi:hypothetical protein